MEKKFMRPWRKSQTQSWGPCKPNLMTERELQYEQLVAMDEICEQLSRIADALSGVRGSLAWLTSFAAEIDRMGLHRGQSELNDQDEGS